MAYTPKKRQTAYTPKSGGTKKGFGPGKGSGTLVRVQDYNADSKDVKEHYLVAEALSDIYNGDRSAVLFAKGDTFKVFMPAERVKGPNGQLVDKQVRSRRDVMGLMEPSAMPYSGGDEMPPGSIVILQKFWSEEVEVNGTKEKVLKANYGLGGLHPLAQSFHAKYPADMVQDGESSEGDMVVGITYGSDTSVTVFPIRKRKYKDKDTGQEVEVATQEAVFYKLGDAVEVKGTKDIAKILDGYLSSETGDFGSQGVLITAYRQVPENLSPEDTADFLADPDNRLAYRIAAYPTYANPEKEGDEVEFEPASGEKAIRDFKERVAEAKGQTGEYLNKLNDALENGGWDLFVVPSIKHRVVKSLIPGDDNNKFNFDYAGASTVYEADPVLDANGEQALTEYGNPKYHNAKASEPGVVAIDYAIVKRSMVYQRSNGVQIDTKTSYANIKNYMDKGGFAFPISSTTDVTALNLAGGNKNYYRGAVYLTDVIHSKTPERVIPYLKEEAKHAVSKASAYGYENRKETENKVDDNDDTLTQSASKGNAPAP